MIIRHSLRIYSLYIPFIIKDINFMNTKLAQQRNFHLNLSALRYIFVKMII